MSAQSPDVQKAFNEFFEDKQQENESKQSLSKVDKEI